MRATHRGSVLISGIGIAGPTLAYWLDRWGFRPTLVERSAALRDGGYAIDFWGIGYDIADRMGLMPSIRDKGYNVRELRIVDQHGRPIGGFSVDIFRTLTHGRYVTLSRSDLSRLLYDQIAAHCETIFNDAITALEPTNDGVWVTFEHTPPREFDLVVGADGLHSNVRELVFGSERRFEAYLGYLVGAFEVKGYRPRDDDTYVAYAVPGKQVGRFALRDDRTLFLFVMAADRPPEAGAHDQLREKEFLWDAFHDLGWECHQILAALEACDDLYFDRVSQIRIDAWSHGRVALIGDAAFAPSLLAGEGAALAMIAAYVLAGELAGSAGRPEVALQRYERSLRGFITDKQQAAERFAGSFAPKTRLGLFVRNQITKAFAIPAVAKISMGSTLIDRFALPDYHVPRGARAAAS